MRRVNRWFPLYMIAFLLIFAAAWVFTGKFIYETAAYVDQECWDNLAIGLKNFTRVTGELKLDMTFPHDGLRTIGKLC